MTNLSNTLLEISLYAAVITGAILLFRAAFHKRVSPRLQYLAWMLLILRLLLPVTLDSGFYVESLLPATPVPVTAPQNEAPAVQESPAAEDMPAAETEVQADVADTITAQEPVAAKPDAAPTAVAPAKQAADPSRVIVTLWLCGMAVFAIWMGAVKLRYARRMRRCRLDTPQNVQALYQNCCKELGVKAPVRLWVVSSVMSPGLALLPRATVLIPADMLDTPEQLRFALLHELTHYKRGDAYMCALMNLLRMAYWFHPVVHYAFSQMQADMETACDADVIAHLGGENKRAYLETILALFSYEAQPQLGMARLSARSMAKRRMQGAFMRNKSATGTVFMAVALTSLLLFGCFTTACQPDPARAAQRVPLEELIAAKPLPPAAYKAPSVWEEQFRQGQLSVTMQAAVEVDSSQKEYSVVRRKTKYVSDSVLKTMLARFAGDIPVYAGQKVFTTQELWAELAAMQAGKPRYGYYPSSYALEECVQTIETKLVYAPEAVEEVLVDRNAEMPSVCHFTLPNGVCMLLGAHRSGLYYAPVESGLHLETDSSARRLDNPWAAPIPEPAITEEAAIEEGYAILQALGVTGVRHRKSEKACLVYVTSFALSEAGWHITYTPEDLENADIRDYTMLINEMGLQWMIWEVRDEGEECLNSNVQLLPFDTAKACIKNAILQTFAEEAAKGDVRFTGNMLRLRNAPIQEPNHALNIPAWYVIGEVYVEGAPYPHEETLVVSALTGALIERYLSYEGIRTYGMVWLKEESDTPPAEQTNAPAQSQPTQTPLSTPAQSAAGSGQEDVSVLENTLGEQILAAAQQVIGKPYAMGSQGPDSFDASGLLYYALDQAGVSISRQSCQAYSETEGWEKLTNMGQLRQGDIMFFYGANEETIEHAGICAGNEEIVDVSSSRGKVVKRPYETRYWMSNFAFALRVS